ncbi:unnamed protein product [Alternaria alternata]
MFSASASSRDKVCENGEDTLTPLPQSPTFRNGYHQRNASDGDSSSDSILADSIINAHVHAMRALEALSADPKSNENVERSAEKEWRRWKLGLAQVCDLVICESADQAERSVDGNSGA